MRVGVPFSIALHVALVMGGIVVAPRLMAEPAPMVILPIDLLTIADTTNVKPVAEEKPKDADKAQETADKTTPAPAAAPEAKPEPVPEPVPDIKKPAPDKPKEAAKPAPWLAQQAALRAERIDRTAQALTGLEAASIGDRRTLIAQ